ncbi:MAG: hypothetical protein QM485_15470 [Flavobacteriaceae bacterium]
MKTVQNIIRRNIQGKKVLLLFLLTNIVYVAMLLVTIPGVMDFANGMNLLDMMPIGYDLEYVDSLFHALGAEGRNAYLYSQIPLDMVYPFLFGISYCLVLAYFLNKLNKLKSPLGYLCLLPLIAGIFDYFENFGILALLSNYPEISNSSVTITSSFTLLKSISTTLYFMILIGFLVLLLIKTSRK